MLAAVRLSFGVEFVRLMLMMFVLAVHIVAVPLTFRLLPVVKPDWPARRPGSRYRW